MEMITVCERLSNPTATELAQVRAIYETNFPPAERKPFEHFVPRLESGEYICMVVRSQSIPGDIVAFAFLMLLLDVRRAFLEYVAVDRAVHGKGIGSELFRAMASYFRENDLAEGVVWEVEPATEDENDDKNRRIRFYERFGSKLIVLSSTYAMPNFETETGGVPLRLMQFPMECQPDATEVRAMITKIYDVAYPDWGELRDEILRELAEMTSTYEP